MYVLNVTCFVKTSLATYLMTAAKTVKKLSCLICYLCNHNHGVMIANTTHVVFSWVLCSLRGRN